MVSIFTNVRVGLALVVSANGSQDSKSSEAQFTPRRLAIGASHPLIVPIDGFNMTAPAYCHGEGTDISSRVENTLKACSEACVTSIAYRAFQFSPDVSNFCTLYDSTVAVSSHGASSACYVQTCGNSTCTFPEVCDGSRCQRVNEKIDVAMQCANLTDTFTEPVVPAMGQETTIAAALAANNQPIHVTQADFSQGFFDITQSGYYQLVEDITIPWINDTLSITSPHQMGQTVGVRMTGRDIVLDLNGFTLQVHEDILRFEPFFNLIQLNNNNFPEGVLGFLRLVSAHRVVIFSSVEKKGTLKFATHYGIMGIKNNDIYIKNVRIEGCAVGGISLLDARNVHIEGVVIDNTNLHSRWTPYFAAVMQLRRRLYQVLQRVTAEELTEWRAMLHYVDLRVTNNAWALNPTPDRILGNAFGIQVKNMLHGKDSGGRDVRITHTNITHIKVGRSEVVAIRDSKDDVLMDADFNVFEWDHFFATDGSPRQCNDTACVTVQKINDIRLRTSSYLCSQNVPGISCMEGLVSKLSGESATLRPLPGADIRGHMPKGAFGVRFVGVSNGIVDNVEIHDIDNAESPARDTAQNHYESPVLWRGREQAKNVFKGHMSFGFYGERCTNVKLESVRALRVKSKWGSAIAVGFGDQSRHIVLREVSAHVEKPRDTEPVKIPNVVPYGMPFYVEEDALSFMQFVNITSLGAFRSGEKHRDVIAVAPVIDCEMHPNGSRLCSSIGTNSPGPTQCSPHAANDTGNDTAEANRTCEVVDASVGLGSVLCCDGTYRSYSEEYVTCHAARNGICRCPSGRPYMCHSDGQRRCVVSPQSCSVIVGQSCPQMNSYTMSSPNCPITELDNPSVVLTCRDGSTCLVEGRRNWECCKNRGGRWKCPPQWPFMCAEVTERCANDHCCSSVSGICTSLYGGLLSDRSNDCPSPLTPTCANHTCSANTDVPDSLTSTSCDGVCDDVQCGCRMQCSAFWKSTGCKESYVPNRRGSLCRSLSDCNEDCCVEESGRIEESGKIDPANVSIGRIALGCLVLLVCFVAAFLALRTYYKDRASISYSTDELSLTKSFPRIPDAKARASALAPSLSGRTTVACSIASEDSGRSSTYQRSIHQDSPAEVRRYTYGDGKRQDDQRSILQDSPAGVRKYTYGDGKRQDDQRSILQDSPAEVRKYTYGDGKRQDDQRSILQDSPAEVRRYTYAGGKRQDENVAFRATVHGSRKRRRTTIRRAKGSRIGQRTVE